MFLSCVQANTEYISKYQKYQIYQIYRIPSKKKNNNKQNRINANENEIRIPAHLYALSHMSYTQYSLTNQHEHKTTINETLQSNGRTAREGVPTYTQTYTHTDIHTHNPTSTHTHTHTYSDPAAWLSLFLKVTHISCCNKPVPYSLSLSLLLSCSLSFCLTQTSSLRPLIELLAAVCRNTFNKNEKNTQTKEQRKSLLILTKKLSKKNQ